MQKNEAGTLSASNKKFCVSKHTIHRMKMQPTRNGREKKNLKNLQLSDFMIDFLFKIHDGIKHPLSPMSVCELSAPLIIMKILKSEIHSFNFKCTVKAVRNISPYWFPFQNLGILVDREAALHPDVTTEKFPFPNDTDATKPKPYLQSKGVKLCPRWCPLEPQVPCHCIASEMKSNWRWQELSGKAQVECQQINITKDKSESEKISKTTGISGRKGTTINREYDFTWERAITELVSFLLLLFWASSLGNESLRVHLES